MNKYALTLVINPDLEEKSRKEITDAVSKKLSEVKKEDAWGVRDLAYPIKHKTKGYYVHFEFELEPDKIAPLDKSLKMEEDIIRYLLVRI